ncbi:MAG: alpha/beta fold hydrolase [Myxococcaceae bacterium]
MKDPGQIPSDFEELPAADASTGGDERICADVILTNEQGDVIVELNRVVLRRTAASPHTSGDPADSLYRLDWHQSGVQAAVRDFSSRWLLVGEDDRVSPVKDQFEGMGVRCRVLHPSRLAEYPESDRVVWLVPNASSASQMATHALKIAVEGLAVAQAVLSQKPAPRLFCVTQSALLIIKGEDVSPPGAAAWGFGRSLVLERPELAGTLLDVDGDAKLAQILLDEAAAKDGENQVGWRGTTRYVARLVRAGAGPIVPHSDNYHLEIAEKGTLDSLRLSPASRRRPSAGEVEIAVKSSGLNFRDVLGALGMHPGDVPSLGGECAGEVVEVGEGVRHLAVGDGVMGVVHEGGAFRRFVTVDARLMVRTPAGLSHEQAATVPIAFLTALYAFDDLARLSRGERVLIHAAAGGVGMAAVQVARWMGASVLATASPAKWPVLAEQGIKDVASSRDLSFADIFRSSGGVDVVLNALAGKFVDASLSILKAGGRFLEMGKTDVRDPAHVKRAHPSVTYLAFDLWEAGPERIAQLLSRVAEGFASGALRALPVKTFPLTDAEQAFRFMGQARHVGKLALVSPREPFRKQGAVLITGGLGALGTHVAKRLAQAGVAHLVLTGRRGAQTAGAHELVKELEATGSKVTVAALDVGDAPAVQRLIANLPAEYPLRGVVHAAGVVDDGLISAQTAERILRVMSPKVLGAWNLHEATQHLQLDFFVLFASMAGTVGSAAQAAYAAANVFLDSFAAWRRTRGFRAKSLAWGAWAEGGMADALDATLRARLARQGFTALSAKEGLSLFEAALSRTEAQLIVGKLDVRMLANAFSGAVPSIWKELLRRAPSPHTTARVEKGGWARELGALPSHQRQAAVTETVRAELARVLSLPGSGAVGADRPFKELGLDSLMAVELRNVLGRRAGTTLSATLAFDYPSSAAIAKHLLKDVFGLTEEPELKVVRRRMSDEPIAIVGMACRFPGAVKTPEDLWRLLENETDAITEVPPERWNVDAWYDPDPDAKGKIVSRWGGFVEALDQFDPAFFRMSANEAPSVDPQERLLLETAWEALERAGITAESLMDSNTGVYVGLTNTEYQARLLRDCEELNAYSLLGTTHSAMVGRLSYWLGLRGPNIPVDTACSSSLVAVHLACQALRSGEVSMALAGGASVMLDPAVSAYFSRVRALSPTGRCRTFSSSADGYTRSEGAGMVVLERLSEARKHGHPVLALVRGTAVNQDGRSNGPTAPNGPAQEAVIAAALERSGLDPAMVDYLECHGTGTRLGDPIEVQAAAKAYGLARSKDRPLLLGSVKTNIGHTEAAAGMAGIIKTVLAIRHGVIPKTLHFDAPNPNIPWNDLPVKVVSERSNWPERSGPRRAAVSSFGFSGTNAHLILEQVKDGSTPVVRSARRAECLVLSGRTRQAVEALASRLHAQLSDPHAGANELDDWAFTLATRRTHHEERAALIVQSKEALKDALGALSRGAASAEVRRGRAGSGGPPRVGFVFTGQGSQRIGMGRQLSEQWPVFKAALDEAFDAFEGNLPRPLREVMWAEPGSVAAKQLNETGFTQPAIFAMEWALMTQWQAWGVEPAWLMGHSIGEVTAACVAGCFSLKDAAKLVAARGRLMQALTSRGAMVALEASEDELSAELSGRGSQVSLAAVNGPRSGVVAGDEQVVSEVAESFKNRGRRVKRLTVSHAFHSPLMDPMLADFREALQSVVFEQPRRALISNLSGGPANAELATVEYWVRHVREPVRFAQGVQALRRAGAEAVLELGPTGALVGVLPECWGEGEEPFITSCAAGQPEAESLLRALGEWHVHGGTVRWEKVFPSGGSPVDLPTYPFQRTRYWIDAKAQAGRGAPTNHPLLRTRLATASTDGVYEATVSPAELPWLEAHREDGTVSLPTGAALELLRAGVQHFRGDLCALRTVSMKGRLSFASGSAVRVQVVVRGDGGSVALYSQSVEAPPGATWSLHATADVTEAAAELPSEELPQLRQRCSLPLDLAGLYRRLEVAGVQCGPNMRSIEQLWTGGDEALAALDLPGHVSPRGWGVHPALLEACFHAAGGHKPSSIASFKVFRANAAPCYVHARTAPGEEMGTLRAEFRLLDEAGQVLAELTGVILGAVPRTQTVRDAENAPLPFSPAELPWEQRMAALPTAERIDKVVDLVRGEIARLLLLPVEDVSAAQSLRQLGFDSLMAMELRTRLGNQTGLQLSASLFEVDTPAAIAEFVLGTEMERGGKGGFSPVAGLSFTGPFNEVVAYKDLVTGVKVTSTLWSYSSERSLEVMEAGRGPPVVLLSGYMTELVTMRSLIRALEPRRRVIGLHYPGIGRSSFVEFTGIADLADTLASGLRTYLGHRPFDLVGYSFGSFVALSLASRHPNDVRSLTLLNGGLWLRSSATQLPYDLAHALDEEKRLAGSQHSAEATLLMEYGSQRRSMSAAAAYAELVAGVNNEELASALRLPTLIVAGETDRVFPLQQSVALEQCIPQSKLAVIAGAGHLALITHAEEVVRVVDGFLGMSNISPPYPNSTTADVNASPAENTARRLEEFI